MLVLVLVWLTMRPRLQTLMILLSLLPLLPLLPLLSLLPLLPLLPLLLLLLCDRGALQNDKKFSPMKGITLDPEWTSACTANRKLHPFLP